MYIYRRRIRPLVTGPNSHSMYISRGRIRPLFTGLKCHSIYTPVVDWTRWTAKSRFLVTSFHGRIVPSHRSNFIVRSFHSFSVQLDEKRSFSGLRLKERDIHMSNPLFLLVALRLLKSSIVTCILWNDMIIRLNNPAWNNWTIEQSEWIPILAKAFKIHSKY